MKDRHVFHDGTCDGEPGKDFDSRVLYDPLPGDAKWHDRAEALAKWAPRWGGYWDHLNADKEKPAKGDEDIT